MNVYLIDSATATRKVEAFHYLHRRPTISHAFGLYLPDRGLLGVVTFGVPASRHLQVGVCPTDPGLVVELNRLWVHDDLPRNTESWFVARALKRLPPLIVVSYADPAWGHVGYIYRALSWHYAGWTDMDRLTPRFDYLPAQPIAAERFGIMADGPVETVHTRDAFRNGYVEKRRRVPKVRYWTTTGNRTEKRRLIGLCGWPSLDWHEQPPPVTVTPASQDGTNG